MQNYMKTILSALQNWINKRLHETVPETNEAHMQLIKDENGATSWEERTHYKEVTTQNVVNLESAELIPLDNDGDGVPDGGQYLLTTPWAVDLVPGGKYTVTYDGVPWECYGIDANEIEAGMSGIVVLGNTDAMGATGVEGGNSDAPFVLMCIPNTSEFVSAIGAYGVFNILGDPPGNFAIAVHGVVTTTTYKELEEGYLPEAVRDSVIAPITFAVDADGNVATDIDFDTAWAMTDAQLANAATVEWKGASYSVRVLHWINVANVKYLQFKFDTLYDPSDAIYVQSTYHFSWISMEGMEPFFTNATNSRSKSYGMPLPTDTSQVCFPVWDGQYFARSVSETRSYLGITDPVAPVFVVTVDNVINNVGTADKTFAEIKAAHDAGQVVVCKYLNNYHRLHVGDETQFIFLTSFCDGQMVFTRAFTISETEVRQTVYVVQLNDVINDAISAVLPTPSTADAGKILRVNSEGKYELVSLPNAEEATF